MIINGNVLRIALLHDVIDALNPEYVPSTAQESLFKQKQLFVYSVFCEQLAMPKSRNILCKYQTSLDAQKVYADLIEHCEDGTVAKIEEERQETNLQDFKLNKY